MDRIALILVIEVTCQAAQSVIGNATVYPEIAVHDERRGEAFIMPADGTIETMSIYHQGGSGEMLLGVYVGDSTPDVRIGVTLPTPVSTNEGWQTVTLTSPVWVPQGTRIWLAWVFQENPGIRYQLVATGWVESDQDWTTGMPARFGDCRQANRTYSICAAFTGDVHPIINEVLPRNDTLSDRQFLDEDWTKQGWIELYNPSDLPIHMASYCLSNSPDALQRWALPDMVMEPHEFLRVWTSGKDRSDPAKGLHTSFNLLDSESLYFTRSSPQSRVDVLDRIRIPVDYSYGRHLDGANRWCFYTQPTPGSGNTIENSRPFAIDQRHVSLTVGVRYQLTVTPPEEVVVWSCDNLRVSVDATGGLLAMQDGMDDGARATVSARSVDGAYVDSCQVTVVDWTANLSELKVVGTPYVSYILGTEGEDLFYTVGRDLYRTSDGFQTSQFLSTLPEDMDLPKMLITPFGYFLQCGRTIFQSQDLVKWTASITMDKRGLDHNLACFWDAESQTGYVYVGEYSADDNHRHAVCRGTFPATGEATWETILDFPSFGEWQRNPSVLDAVRHVLSVAVDPYTGHVWVATGANNLHSRLLYSDDKGESFRLVGMGSQTYRTLSIWFTERYVYWSMNTYGEQCCWRIPRSQFARAGVWPCMTPERTSGTTKTGVAYLVTASDRDGHFPATVGQVYVESEARVLDQRNRVRALDDPEYDYKEKVAELFNGTLWYHLWVRDDQGEPILILGQAAEGAYRDFRGRAFGIKELPDGNVDVQELLSVGSIQPDKYDGSTMYVQLEPKAQDASGYIYFTGRTTGHRGYKTKLNWTDNPSVR